MFIPGTKIVVLASTKCHGLGPRLGSVGFVQECSDKQSVSNFIGTFGALVTLNNVIFTRFGFETKERLERKRVILVFPVLTNTEKIPANGQIKHFVKVIGSKKKNQISRLCLHKRFNVPQNTPVMLAAPSSLNKNLVKASSSEFTAWFESHIKTAEFFSWLTEAVLSRHYTNFNMPQINRNSLELFVSLITNKTVKDAYIEDVVHSEDRRHSVINTVQPMLVTSNKYFLRKVYEEILRSLIEGDYRKQTNLSITNLISKYIFYPGIDNILAKSVKLTREDKLATIVGDIKATKEAISGLSSRFC